MLTITSLDHIVDNTGMVLATARYSRVRTESQKGMILIQAISGPYRGAQHWVRISELRNRKELRNARTLSY